MWHKKCSQEDWLSTTRERGQVELTVKPKQFRCSDENENEQDVNFGGYVFLRACTR